MWLCLDFQKWFSQGICVVVGCCDQTPAPLQPQLATCASLLVQREDRWLFASPCSARECLATERREELTPTREEMTSTAEEATMTTTTTTTTTTTAIAIATPEAIGPERWETTRRGRESTPKRLVTCAPAVAFQIRVRRSSSLTRL